MVQCEFVVFRAESLNLAIRHFEIAFAHAAKATPTLTKMGLTIITAALVALEHDRLRLNN
jgi:hypothetical protein